MLKIVKNLNIFKNENFQFKWLFLEKNCRNCIFGILLLQWSKEEVWISERNRMLKIVKNFKIFKKFSNLNVFFGKKIVEIVYLGFSSFSDRRKKSELLKRILKIVKNLKIFKNENFEWRSFPFLEKKLLKLYIWDSPPSMIEKRNPNFWEEPNQEFFLRRNFFPF